ncbi:hypothetical protein EYF80_021355 [Liparis tanakae]|uniref:Uncharacterized protein n=1 Tax=Liparis tanakae TaxID=230148 RepID=A0A4Z2HTW1_9TELE|nr:hypothetical protein EYF80_021355 [Liparis tanakae]
MSDTSDTTSIWGWARLDLTLTYLTVVDGGQELVAAQRKLGSVIAVHPLPSVVQMLEVMWRH